MAAGDDISSLLGDPLEPSPQEKTQALIDALRGQRREAAIMMLHPLLQDMGKSQMADVQQRQQMGLQRAMAAQTQAAEMARQQNELAAKAREDELNRRNTLNIASMGKFTGVSPGAPILNTRTGEVTGGASSDSGGGTGKPLNPKQVDDDFNKFAGLVSTYQGRSNLNRELQDKLNGIERVEGLIKAPNGDIRNLGPELTSEATSSWANALSTGKATMEQLHALTPDTMANRWARFEEKFKNEPQGAESQAFLAQILESLKNTKDLAYKQIRTGQLQALPNYAHLRKLNSARFESILKAPGVGIDPATIDENGLEMKAAPTGGGNIDLTQPPSSGSDVVMMLPPGGSKPVPVHKAKVQAAIKAGGRLVGG